MIQIKHLIYLGINGGENLIPKYLSWYKAFKTIGVSYEPIFIHSLYSFPQIPGEIKQLYIPISRKKCFMVRLINRSANFINDILNKKKPDVVVLRIETYSRKIHSLMEKFPIVLEYPFLPLQFLHKTKPFYLKLTHKYEGDIINKSQAVLATLSIFKNLEPFKRKKLFIFPNSLEPSLYKPKKFIPFN